MAANALSYIKNVGKSVAYVSFKVAKDMNPVLTEYGENNAELARTIYKTARNLKKNIRKMPEIIMESEYGKFGKSYITNLIDDAKTGKFYNKEREDEYLTNAANSFAGLDDMEGDGFSDLDNLDFSDSDDFGDDEISSNEMMDMVGEKASSAVSTAVAKSAEYIAESNVQVAKARTKQINILYTGMLSGMTTINHNLSKVIEFSTEQTITHYENSRTYFEANTRLNEERNNILKSMSESLIKLSEPPKQEENKRDRYSNISDYDGIVDFGEYFKAIKDNIAASTGGLADMLQMISTTGGLQNLAASPLSFIVENIIKSTIPKALEKSMEQFNSTIGSLFGNMMVKLQEKGENADGGIWETIANIFGVQPTKRTTIDTSKYEKGRVPFDGITRKAITEVIPTYLSKILSAITGRKEDRFNYESGKFITVEDLQKSLKNSEKSNAESAASELTTVVRNNKNKLKFSSKEQEQQFDRDWQDIAQWMYKNQKTFNTNDKTLTGDSFDLTGGNVSDLNVKLLQYLISTYGRTENMGYAHRMYRTIANSNQNLDKLQQSGVINSVFDGSAPTSGETRGIKGIIDSANSETVSELKAIRKEVSYIRRYGLPGGSERAGLLGGLFGGKKGSKESNIPFDKFKIDNVYTPSSDNYNYSYDDDLYSSPVYTGDDIDKNNLENIAADIISKGKVEFEDNKVKHNGNSEQVQDGQTVKKRKTLFDRIRSFKKGTKELIGVPLNFMSAVITKVDDRLYDLVFGIKTDEDEDKGFLEKMMEKVDVVFEDFSGYLQEHILEPLSDKFEKIFNKDNILNAVRKIFKMFDSDYDKVMESIKNFFTDPKGAIGSFWQDYKQSLKEMFGFAKKSVKDTAEWAGVSTNPELTEEGKKKVDNINSANTTLKKINNLMMGKKAEISEESKSDKKEKESEPLSDLLDGTKEAATGIKKVDKTGLAVISEGEMIVPPDMNPFNISKRKRNEKKVKKDLKKGIDSIYEFAEGKTSDSFEKLTQEEQDTLKDKIRERLRKRQKEKIKKNMLTNEDYVSGERPIQERIMEEAASAIKAVNDSLKGIVGDADSNNRFKQDAIKFMGDVKQYGGTIAAGATVGAGVSLVTGLIGGPLLGAAVGAATGLLAKSETFQNMLFGEKLDNGERAGGLLSKDLSNNIKKYMPDMAKGATAGSIISILPFVPGGPLAGIIVGSAIGFAKNNENVQNMLFGPDSLLGDKDAFQSKIRRLAPKAGVGAIAGLLAGPFGSPMMNILMGSAIGFASDTNTFKDIVFGEQDQNGNRQGGILGTIKGAVEDNIIDPLKSAREPVVRQIQLIGEHISDLFKGAFDFIGQHIKDALDEHVLTPLKNFAKKAFGGIFAKIIRGITSIPGKLINAIGDGLRTHQVKIGEAKYMSAKERMLYREEKGLASFGFGDKFKSVDESLANMNKMGDVERISEILGYVKDKDKGIDEVTRSSTANIKNKFKEVGIDSKIKSFTMRLVKTGRYDEAQRYVEDSNIEEDKKKQLLKVIAAESARHKMADSMRNNTRSTVNDLAAEMNKLGFNVTEDQLNDQKYVKKLQRIVNGEIDQRNKYSAKADIKKTGFENEEDSKNSPTTEAVNELAKAQEKQHQDTIEKIDKLLELLNKSVDIESDLYQATLNRQTARNNAYSGLSNNPEDLELLNDKSLDQDSKFTRFKKHANETMHSNKNVFSKGAKIAGDAINIGAENLEGPTRAVKSFAKQGIDTVNDFGKESISLAKDIYGAARNNPVSNKIFGKKGSWYHGIMSEGEVVLSKDDAEKAVDNLDTNAEGKVPGEKNANSLYGIWKDIKKGISQIAAITSANAYLAGVDISKISDKGTITDYLNKIKNKYGKLGDSVTQFVNGLPIRMIRDKNGELIPDPSSSENDDNFEIINGERETQKGILASLQGMPSALGNFFKEVQNTDLDEEESIFSKILGFFTGKSKFSLSNILNTVLNTVISNAIPIGIAAFFLNDKFNNAVKVFAGIMNNAFHAMTNGAFGKNGYNDKMYAQDSEGNSVEVQTDENGNAIKDEEGNYVSTSGESVSGKVLENKGSLATMSFTDRLKYNFVRGLGIKGRGSVIESALKSSGVGKIIRKAAKVIDATGALDKVKLNVGISEATADQAYSVIVERLTKWKNAMKGIPVLRKYADKLDDLAVAIMELIEKNLKKSPKALASTAKSLAKWIGIALVVAGAVIDFTTGMQDASTTLKIREEDVTFPHRLLCGLLRSLKNFIPIIGTLIPDQLVIDLFVKYLENWVGYDFMAARDAAEQELEDYKQATGDDTITWAEYNKKVKGNYTWTERLSNSIKSGWNSFKGWFTGKSESPINTTNNIKSSEYAGAGSVRSISKKLIESYDKQQGNYTGKGSGIGRGSFVSQLDPKYRNTQFNIPGDSTVQTLGDTGCAPAAAAMAINSITGSDEATMEGAANDALKFKVNNDGVTADYFGSEFAKHGLKAQYMEASGRDEAIMSELANNKSVVLMGEDKTNMSKKESPFGPNPHYVVATGMSKDKKYIFINDPEAATPNIKYSADKILNNVSLGIAADRAGSGTKKITNKLRKYIGRGAYDKNSTQYKVWNALINAGYNDIAAAAAMGNIQHESGFDPSIIEHGSGVGFGLVQWSYGRRTAFENYAKSKGVNPSDLGIQIEYLLKELEPGSGIWTSASSKYHLGSFKREDWANATDLAAATKAFMCCFERPDYDPKVNAIDLRLKYAEGFYEAFTGVKADPSSVIEYSNFGSTDQSSTDSTSSSTSSNTSGGLLGQLSNIFSGLAKAFGLGDSSSSSSSDTSSSYSGQTSLPESASDAVVPKNGYDGNVTSDPEKAELQRDLVKKMYSVYGKLRYQQDNEKYPGSRNPDEGGGDCSSTVQWVYKNVLGANPGSTTAIQRGNVEDTYSPPGATTKDESTLQLGDLLLRSGHVEMYAGDGKTIGHGGGDDGKQLGPTEKNLDTSGRYDVVKRWIGFKPGSGSGLKSSYGKALRYVDTDKEAKSSVLALNTSDLSNNKSNVIEFNSNKANVYGTKRKLIGRATDIPNVSDTKQSVSSNDTNNLLTIIQEIIKLLVQIVTNTDALNKILELLSQLVTTNSGTPVTATVGASTEDKTSSIAAKQNLINAIQSAGNNSNSTMNAQLMKLIEDAERIARQ